MPHACLQVGNQTIDHLYWGRPEDITPTTYGARLVYVVDPTHPAADVVGAAAAALAATAQAGACDDRQIAWPWRRELPRYTALCIWDGEHAKSYAHFSFTLAQGLNTCRHLPGEC